MWTIKQTDEYGHEGYLWNQSWIADTKYPLKFFNRPYAYCKIYRTRKDARDAVKVIKAFHPCACEKGRFKLSVVKYVDN